MKILITGGNGTLGGYIVRELHKAGHSLSCFSRTPTPDADVRYIQGDIHEAGQLVDACQGHEAIIHLAGVPGPGRAAPAELLKVNVIGTVNFLEAALQTEIGRVVLASSGAATGFSFPQHKLIPKYLPLDEQHPCRPQDEYGLSKLLAEQTCRRYSDAFGIRTICLRINNNWYLIRKQADQVVGRGWAKSLTGSEDLWTRRYRKTIEDPHGEGDWPVPGPPLPANLLWAFTDARDAAQAFRLAVENDTIQHEVFLINGDDTCSTVETRDLVARHDGDVPLKVPLGGHATLWSYEKAQRILGYQPHFTWRDSDFSQWLNQRNN